jgi:hypothetical protein
LEDDFDGQNRMNLRHFIGLNESKKPLSDDDNSSVAEYPLSYYYVQNPSMYGPIDEKTVERRIEIERIPTFAIFHKLASGKGVPHTFVGEFVLFMTFWRFIHVSWCRLYSPMACSSSCRSMYNDPRSSHI